MTALRIALFSGNYNYVMDGPVRALNRLVGYLEKQGHTVLVFAPTSDTPACEPEGELVSVPSIPLPGRSEYRLALGLPRSRRRRVRAFQPDIVHLAAPDWLGHAAQGLARRLDTPCVASFHTRFDTYLRYYGCAWLEQRFVAHLARFYNRCERVYAPSRSMIQTLREQGVESEVKLWSRGVDRDVFSPQRRDLEWRRSLGIADDESVIVFVGRVVKEKGLCALAAAYDRLRQSGARARFLVVGEGPERPWLQKRMPDAIFTGFLCDEPLGRAYASSDIFFNPSQTETFGNVTLEAIASGLPVVCADATGSRSIINHGETGLLSRSGSEDDFASLLETLVENPQQRAAYGAAAREASQSYCWDAVMGGLLASYYEVIESRRERAAAAQEAMSRAALAAS